MHQHWCVVNLAFLSVFNTRGHVYNNLVLFLFQTGAGGRMSSDVMPMSRPGNLGNTGSMGGGYAGATDMTNNGLSTNQNQVSLNHVSIVEF